MTLNWKFYNFPYFEIKFFNVSAFELNFLQRVRFWVYFEFCQVLIGWSRFGNVLEYGDGSMSQVFVLE